MSIDPSPATRIYTGTTELVAWWDLDQHGSYLTRRVATVDTRGVYGITRFCDLRVCHVDPDGAEHEMTLTPPAGPAEWRDGAVGRGALLWAVVCTPLMIMFLVGLYLNAAGLR